MDNLGLYIHIPFCSFMCHYCDFAKTANWDPRLLQDYIRALDLHLEAWLEEYVAKRAYNIDSIFIGGGSPSLLTDEWAPIFARLDKYKVKAHEISLEANPEHISERSLRIWREFGINRLSVGVQTFQEKGLKFLTRQHKALQIEEALHHAALYFDNISCDLIYAWSGQNIDDWHQDLEKVFKHKLSHLSLYCLTYEDKTPIGRAHKNGKILASDDEFQEACYLIARQFLKAKGWDHYECSNWSLPDKNCQHNIKYWQDQYYIAVGNGACGYLPEGDFGTRYRYQKNERLFTRDSQIQNLSFKNSPVLAFCELDARSKEDWLTEYVGCGLRYNAGIDLAWIAKKTGWNFLAHGLVKEALAKGTLNISNQRLRLSPEEWFRETRWCLEILECFVR